MKNILARDACERELAGLLPMLSHDELRVVTVQVRRMIKIGREKYGPLDLSREKRDWATEAGLELSDRLFYDACEVIADMERNRECVEGLNKEFDLSEVTAEYTVNRSDSECAGCSAPVGAAHRMGCK